MAYNDENLEVVLKYAPEELLYEVYKFKRINNLGVRCSRIEEVKRNREILCQNLLKPINKNHFSKWLFAYFTKVKKKDIDSSIDNLKVKEHMTLVKLLSEGRQLWGRIGKFR